METFSRLPCVAFLSREDEGLALMTEERVLAVIPQLLIEAKSLSRVKFQDLQIELSVLASNSSHDPAEQDMDFITTCGILGPCQHSFDLTGARYFFCCTKPLARRSELLGDSACGEYASHTWLHFRDMVAVHTWLLLKWPDRGDTEDFCRPLKMDVVASMYASQLLKVLHLCINASLKDVEASHMVLTCRYTCTRFYESDHQSDFSASFSDMVVIHQVLTKYMC